MMNCKPGMDHFHSIVRENVEERRPASGARGPRTFRALTALLLLIGVAAMAPAESARAAQQPSFGTRVEARFGDSPFYFSSGDWRAKRHRQWTNIRSGERKIAANFVVEDADVPVAIMFSSEAYVDTPKKRMFLRLLIDGEPMAPADVVLASAEEQNRRAAQSFEFTALVDAGLHTVEAQWLVDDGATGYVRQVGLHIRQGDVDLARGALLGVTPASGPSVKTESEKWQDVPGLATSIHTRERDCLSATVSAEAFAGSNKVAWLRVLIDGAAASPGAVEFVRGSFEGTRSMLFGQCDLDQGEHELRVQWRADEGGSAWLGDRTLTVSALPQGNTATLRQFFTAASDHVAAPSDYDLMPDMSSTALVSANSEITALLSVEFPDPPKGDIHARLVVHGQPVPDSEVRLADSQTNAGAHAFVFNAKHVQAQAGATLGDIEIEWRGTGDDKILAGARSMSVTVQPQPVPDLATPPPFNGLITGAGVEPMNGARDVLVILWDPARPDHPAPSIAELEGSFSNASNSIVDYYDKISDGRLELDVVDVLGPYDANFPASHYWTGPGDHQDKWVEAISAADDEFDFSAFDRDGDGYVHPWNELAIVIVVPQDTPAGFVRHLWDGSGDTPIQFDGVDIELITEWYTNDPLNDYMVAAHELGHQIFMLPDIYGKNLSAGPPLQHGTRPGRLSLMDSNPFGLTAHLDAGLKLALGWVTPQIVDEFGSHVLDDVKTSHEVLVLPRLPGGADAEYLVLENRQDAAGNSLYDMNIGDSGIAVWHLVEGLTDNAPPPPCTSGAVWNAQTGTDNPRRGIRLLRPSITYNNANALWSNEQYDFDPFGLTCPSDGPPHNVLRWADGSLAWSILNFGTSGAAMTFDLQTP